MVEMVYSDLSHRVEEPPASDTRLQATYVPNVAFQNGVCMDTRNKPRVTVVTRCEYLQSGMRALFCHDDVTLQFIHCIDDLVITDDDMLRILLVLDMSGPGALREFKAAVDFLNQINTPRKTGVLVSRYNEYLTQYISRKFRGRVTFFNAHNLASGLFRRNFLSWLKGKAVCPMRTVARFRDDRYGFSMKEWVTLVIPLSGESMQDIADCMGVHIQSLYQIRQNALKKIGLKSWRAFCELYLRGEIRTENNRVTLR